MTTGIDRSRGAGHGHQPGRKNPHDMQVDEETGRPVAIVPDGEKPSTRGSVNPDEALRIDPESRVPRPVQPDLA